MVTIKERRGWLRTASAVLANAVKLVAPGTLLRVRIVAESAGGFCRLSVHDNGIGIAAQHCKRNFHTFGRLHGTAKYAGTGIGLAIVRKAVERLGGSFGVDSEPGKGSRFWIELKSAWPSTTSFRTTQRPILIVEDDKNDAFFLTRALEKAGVTETIRTVVDGQQALDYLGGWGSSPAALGFHFPVSCFSI